MLGAIGDYDKEVRLQLQQEGQVLLLLFLSFSLLFPHTRSNRSLSIILSFNDSASIRESEARASTLAKNKQRLVYEKLLAEKGTVDMKVTKVNERCVKANSELEDARRLCISAREARDAAGSTLERASAENEKIEAELSEIQKEVRLSDDDHAPPPHGRLLLCPCRALSLSISIFCLFLLCCCISAVASLPAYANSLQPRKTVIRSKG